jgi:hypothetical protein
VSLTFTSAAALSIVDVERGQAAFTPADLVLGFGVVRTSASSLRIDNTKATIISKLG